MQASFKSLLDQVKQLYAELVGSGSGELAIVDKLDGPVPSHYLRRPTGTYRLQLHSGFRLDDADRIVGYLHDLGVSDVYLSPYLAASPETLRCPGGCAAA